MAHLHNLGLRSAIDTSLTGQVTPGWSVRHIGSRGRMCDRFHDT